MKRLDQQAAIITGGSKGIGLAIATRFFEEGAKVLIADILEKEAKEAVDELRAKGAQVEYYILDVRDVQEVYKMAQFCLDKFGGLDVLVNNAGVQKPCPSMELSEDVFDWIMDVNLKGAFFCSQAAGRIMRERGGGRIVNISSGNSRMVNLGRAPYCMSKTGINSMTSVLGAEWAMYNIRVNAIAPGWIKTAMVERGMALKAINEQQIFSVSPVERWGQEREIADLALYLASDESSYIVGQTIFCDGGWSTGMLPNALQYVRDNDPFHKEK